MISKAFKEVLNSIYGNPWLVYPFRIVVKPLVFCKYGIFRYYSLNNVIFKTF